MHATRQKTRRRLRSMVASIASFALVLTGAIAAAAPAQALPGDPQYLSVSKTVTPAEVSPGQPFTYTITVKCSEASCLDATLDDALPEELAGYPIQNVTMQPGTAVMPRDVTWTVDGVASATRPAVATADTSLHVDFTGAVTAPSGTGLQNGQTFTITITLQVPDTVAPGDHIIVNTAETAATNSEDDRASATVTVRVPEVIDVDVTKTWTPATQTYAPGAASTIALGVINASNGPVETLILQEPADAVDGADALADSNPFTITDFTGFGSSALPEGADTVQVDAYVFRDGAWTWVTGTSGALPELPAGVDPADVGGLRFTYTGEAIVEGATGSVELGLAQRATQRDTDADLSTQANRVVNVVAGTAAVEGRDPVTDTATAPYVVNPVTIDVDVVKDITPGRIAAGDSAQARIAAVNSSDTGVDELRIADLDYFTADVTFAGFTAAPVWPDNAGAATLTYYLLDGDPVEIDLTRDEIPAAPDAPISGFEIVFTAVNGGIAPAASTQVDFTISTAEGATGAQSELSTTNIVVADVRAPNGLTGTDDDSAPLVLVEPAIDIVFDKQVRPSAPVAPGESVVTELSANLTTTSDYVTADQIVIEDSWTGDGGFWDAFDIASIAPTQVPADTTLTITVLTPSGDWITLATFPAQSGPFLGGVSEEELAAALPGGVATTDLRGIRFTFDSEDPDGFAADTTVTPYIVFDARSTLRSSGESVAPNPDEPVLYENLATVTGTGHTGSGTDLTASEEGVGEATVEGENGEGPIGIDKRWNLHTVAAQSQSQRSTTLNWSVGEGYGQVVITDPTNAAAPQDSVFEAFDLVALNAIAASAEPFSNGWFLRYDTITAVELFQGGAWVPVAAPADGWIQNGRFVGYLLNATQRAEATGVRLVLAENTAARVAAAQAGPAYDPFAPVAGTGVAASSADRTFTLTWQIRDRMRVSNKWVTDEALYNTADAGAVSNTVQLAATPIAGGTPVTATGEDTILIVNPGPGVTLIKQATPSTPLYVPMAGSAPSAYPSATFTLTARNNSVARASYVRVMDPPLCTDAAAISACQSAATAAGALADPFTPGVEWLTAAGQGNPFERFDATSIRIAASIPAEVDLNATTVWLLTYVDGAYATVATTAAAVNTMTAADLADVVGISVTFQGTDPVANGGSITSANQLTITIAATLRAQLRSTGEDQTVSANERETVTNRGFAQSYDPILSDGVATGAQSPASVLLTGGDINVAPQKSVSPTTITAPTRTTPVTVTLGANQGTAPVSTLAPAEVRLTDDATSSPEFWNSFDFTGLGAITAPAGADQVVVSVYGAFGEDGALEWVSSDAAPLTAPVVPVDAADYGQIQGIRFAFSRADGTFFSPAVPAPTWSTTAAFTVLLRDTYRDSGEVLELEGSVENTVSVISDRLNGESSEVKTTDAAILLTPGTVELAVRKVANNGNHFGNVGESAPWALTFQNVGTGYVTVTELRDTLPPELLYTGTTEPVFTPDPAGLLPEPESVVLEGSELVFTWPEGSQMLPGETFGIELMLELQPGLTTGQQAVNTMTVQTEESLDSCRNIQPGGSITPAWSEDATTCGTTDYVTPSVGPNLFTVKGVRGALPGAANPAAPTQTCAQNLSATGGDYFRAPCAANSVIGGTDDWVLRSLNAGTTLVEQLTVFDQLPTAGDQSLISGASRGSVYRPQLVDAVTVTAPAGATTIVEVTNSAAVCAGTWSNLVNQEPCAQNGEAWTVADDYTDWAAVTGLRISVDFRTTPAGALTPGQFVDVTYSSVNVPASADDPDGAPSSVPAADSYAWNQFGVKYRDVGTSAFSKIAPARVGVHLLFGAVQIDKVVTGPASAYSPGEFRVDLVCTIEGVTLDMGASAVVTLNEANGFTQRVDGIPVGAECVATEQGEVGAFGEAERSGTPATLTVAESTTAAQDVPAAQIATIGNDYRFSGLSVTKRVETDAIAGRFGPFDFTLSCVSGTGIPVLFPGDVTEVEFSLEDGETYTAPADTIPVGAECAIAEVGDSAANGIVIVGTGVTDNADGTATVAVGQVAGEVEFVNSYDTGILTVVKEVDGDGAQLYGAGPFTFTATCEYRGQMLLEDEFLLDADAQRTFGPFPTSTECTVAETGTGGATSTTLDPEDGVVVIVDDPDASAIVTATNTFELTAIEVEKLVEGATDVPGARAPFTVELVCVLPVDGDERDIAIPGGPTRTLQAPDALVATYDQLPVDALCTLTETQTQGAASTAFTVVTTDDTGATTETVTEGTSASVSLAGAGANAQVRIANVFVPPIAWTGSTGSAFVGLAIVLLLGGAALIVFAVRRRRATSS